MAWVATQASGIAGGMSRATSKIERASPLDMSESDMGGNIDEASTFLSLRVGTSPAAPTGTLTTRTPFWRAAHKRYMSTRLPTELTPTVLPSRSFIDLIGESASTKT